MACKKYNGYNHCVVPQCPNTTFKFPGKQYFCVPTNLKRRRQWFLAAHRDPESRSSKSMFFFCEDHFDMREDIRNYYAVSLMGDRPRLKQGVIPHKFECQGRGVNVKPRANSKARSNKKLVQDLLAASEKDNKTCNLRGSDSPSQEGKLLEQKTEVVDKNSTTCRTEIDQVGLPHSTINNNHDKNLSVSGVDNSVVIDGTNYYKANSSKQNRCVVTKYVYNLCFQEFYKSIDLTYHILDHSGSTSFDCYVCGEDLKCLELLDKHFSEKHGPALLIC